jgi:hypothetical protein
VNWLREMSDEIRAAESGNAKRPGLAREPIRALLAKTVEDSDVAVGDDAFMVLEQLNFSTPTPAISGQFLYRKTEKPPALDGMNVCTPTASCFTLIAKAS